MYALYCSFIHDSIHWSKASNSEYYSTKSHDGKQRYMIVDPTQ